MFFSQRKKSAGELDRIDGIALTTANQERSNELSNLEKLIINGVDPTIPNRPPTPPAKPGIFCPLKRKGEKNNQPALPSLLLRRVLTKNASVHPQ